MLSSFVFVFVFEFVFHTSSSSTASPVADESAGFSAGALAASASASTFKAFKIVTASVITWGSIVGKCFQHQFGDVDLFAGLVRLELPEKVPLLLHLLSNR